MGEWRQAWKIYDTRDFAFIQIHDWEELLHIYTLRKDSLATAFFGAFGRSMFIFRRGLRNAEKRAVSQ